MLAPTLRTVFAAAALLTACTSTDATVASSAAGPEGALAHSLESGASIHLRADRGLYLVAELGGGGAVHADRVAAGPWETFTVITESGAKLQHGGRVVLRTQDGRHYLQASLGGGHGVTAASTNAGSWETFTLVKASGSGEITTGDPVGLVANSGNYLVAEEGGGRDLNADRTALGPWETFTLELDGSSPAPAPTPNPIPDPSGVLPEDTVLVPPQASGPMLGTVTGYEMDSPCPFADQSHCQLPMYLRYDRNTDEFWDILVQELLHSRINVVMAHGRGCYDPNQGLSGNGNMCPRLLTRLVAAIDRAGARDVMRLGMFDDTGAYQGTRDTVDNLPQSTRFDLNDRSAWRFFWDHNMRVWFDTVPKELWARLDGKPIVAFWTLSSYFFVNQRGNASLMLRELKRLFNERYGEEPLFIVDSTWVTEDPTITAADVAGVNDWFNPSVKNFTYHAWNGTRWGATVPGFRDPDHAPGCGAPCREYARRDGASLREALDAGAGAKFVLLEGWTDIAESAGYYRSAAWRFPNQYLETVREYADPSTPTLRLEAEAADEFNDDTPGNLGGEYRSGDLDIGRIPGGGWDVGWTSPGEWLRFKEVAHACGNYRFTARVASPLEGQRIKLRVGGVEVSEVAVPNTGGWDNYQPLHLGSLQLPNGKDDLTVEFTTGGVNLDWVFVRKASSCP